MAWQYMGRMNKVSLHKQQQPPWFTKPQPLALSLLFRHALTNPRFELSIP